MAKREKDSNKSNKTDTSEALEEEVPQWLLELIEQARERSLRQFATPARGQPGFHEDVCEEDENICEGLCEEIPDDQWLIDLVRNIHVDTTPRPGFREELWEKMLTMIDEMGDIITGKDENDKT